MKWIRKEAERGATGTVWAAQALRLGATVVRGKWRAVAACHKLVAHVARCRFVGAFIMHASALKRSCRGKDRARQRQRKSVRRGHVGLSMCK